MTMTERYLMSIANHAETEMTERYFKILVDGKSCHGGDLTWSLPDGDKPGDWMPKLTKIVLCRRGYHIVMAHQIPYCLVDNCQIYEAETSGKVIGDSDKFVCGKVRLVKQMRYDPEITPRLLSADFAEHVLHLYENKYPGDDRPRKTVEAARKFARKQITRGEMEAARAAAKAAARDIKDAAGYAALAAWDVAWAAWAACEDNARAAVRYAAGNAVLAATWEAEHDWQGQQLLKYLDGELQ